MKGVRKGHFAVNIVLLITTLIGLVKYWIPPQDNDTEPEEEEEEDEE